MHATRPSPDARAFIGAVAVYLVVREVAAAAGLSGVPAVALAEWLGFILVPFLVLRGTAHGLRIQPTSARRLLAGVVMAGAGLPLAQFLAWAQSPWIEPDPASLEALRRGLAGDGRAGMAFLFLGAAVTPAICEEVLFRKVLLRDLKRWGPVVAVGVSALAFGLLHWAPGAAFRVIPTAGLGALAGVVAWRTGSVLPAILFHLAHNGGILLAASRVSGWTPGGVVPATELPGVPTLSVGIACVAIAIHLAREDGPRVRL